MNAYFKILLLTLLIVGSNGCSSQSDKNDSGYIPEFDYSKPTAAYQTIKVNGPIHEVRLKNKSVKYGDNLDKVAVGYMLESSLENPKNNYFFVFDSLKRLSVNAIVRDSSILNLDSDSIKKLLNLSMHSAAYFYDSLQHITLAHKCTKLQEYPFFLSYLDLAPPLYFPESFVKDFFNRYAFNDSYKPRLRHYRYEFDSNNRLKTRFYTNGRLLNNKLQMRTAYPQIKFEAIKVDTLKYYVTDYRRGDDMAKKIGKTEYEKNKEHYKIHYYLDPDYVTSDSLALIYSRFRIDYFYNEKGLVTEKRNSSVIGWERGIGYFQRDRSLNNHLLFEEGDYDSEFFVYDNLNRLDSHYVVYKQNDDYDKFYYSAESAIPDSIFRSKRYSGVFGNGVTDYVTHVLDDEGKITKNIYYTNAQRDYIYNIYYFNYSEYDEYHNWKRCTLTMMPYYKNKPGEKEPILLHEQQRHYKYYERK